MDIDPNGKAGNNYQPSQVIYPQSQPPADSAPIEPPSSSGPLQPPAEPNAKDSFLGLPAVIIGVLLGLLLTWWLLG